MLLVSVVLWLLLDVTAGDVTIRLLGVFATPAQRASYRAQLGLDAPSWQRYADWLIGSDWRAKSAVGLPLVTVNNQVTGEQEWWANVNGKPTQWRMEDGVLVARQLQPDGTVAIVAADVVWSRDSDGTEYFWGVDENNNAVKWLRNAGAEVWVLTSSGLRRQGDGPQQYVPLRRGLLRGDPGMSLQTGRPVGATLWSRLRNSLVLAATALVVVMPLALLVGIWSGANEGTVFDRFSSVTGLILTATPEYVTGIFLILIFGVMLEWVPAVSIFTSPNAVFENPSLLILPVMTLTAIELGYVSRMTRASMVEVMDTAYIRTAVLKGLPRRRIITHHALRNALLVPITVIMLHVNWLIGGLVVVEVIFGYPGLGKYIYDAALFGDFNAVEAAAMILVVIAVATRLAGDLLYAYLNPKLRYAA